MDKKIFFLCSLVLFITLSITFLVSAEIEYCTEDGAIDGVHLPYLNYVNIETGQIDCPNWVSSLKEAYCYSMPNPDSIDGYPLVPVSIPGDLESQANGPIKKSSSTILTQDYFCRGILTYYYTSASSSGTLSWANTDGKTGCEKDEDSKYGKREGTGTGNNYCSNFECKIAYCSLDNAQICTGQGTKYSTETVSEYCQDKRKYLDKGDPKETCELVLSDKGLFKKDLQTQALCCSDVINSETYSNLNKQDNFPVADWREDACCDSGRQCCIKDWTFSIIYPKSSDPSVIEIIVILKKYLSDSFKPEKPFCAFSHNGGKSIVKNIKEGFNCDEQIHGWDNIKSFLKGLGIPLPDWGESVLERIGSAYYYKQCDGAGLGSGTGTTGTGNSILGLTGNIVSEENLIAYYNFDSDKIDSAGNHNANCNFLLGRCPTQVQGISGNAYEFDGKDDYLTLSNSNDFNFGTGDYAISLWIKFPISSFSEASSWEGIISKGFRTSAATTGSWGIVRYSKSINAIAFQDVKEKEVGEADKFNTNLIVKDIPNDWNNIIITRSSGTTSIYLNKNKIKESATPATLTTLTPTDVLIGQANGRYLKGVIDEIAVYNKALSQSDIDLIYNEFISPPIQPVCGNGIKEEGEECDDGNTNNNDGCSSICKTETPITPPTPTSPLTMKWANNNSNSCIIEYKDSGGNPQGRLLFANGYIYDEKPSKITKEQLTEIATKIASTGSVSSCDGYFACENAKTQSQCNQFNLVSITNYGVGEGCSWTSETDDPEYFSCKSYNPGNPTKNCNKLSTQEKCGSISECSWTSESILGTPEDKQQLINTIVARYSDEIFYDSKMAYVWNPLKTETDKFEQITLDNDLIQENSLFKALLESTGEVDWNKCRYNIDITSAQINSTRFDNFLKTHISAPLCEKRNLLQGNLSDKIAFANQIILGISSENLTTPSNLDINGDNYVAIGDVITELKFALHPNLDFQNIFEYDANGDGKSDYMKCIYGE